MWRAIPSSWRAIISVFTAPLLAIIFAVPILAGGDTPTLSCVSAAPGGDTNTILHTIRLIESGDNYNAQAPKSSASGAYQFTDATWNNYNGYPRAVNAPAAIQDAKALEHATTILNQNNGDISLIGPIWYIGHTPTAAEWDTIPFPGAGNKLTPRQYQAKWLNTYNNLTTQTTNTDDEPTATDPKPAGDQDDDGQDDENRDGAGTHDQQDDIGDPPANINCHQGTIAAIAAHGPPIEVDASIAPNVERLIADSRTAGLLFGGWGLRDHMRQHELRRPPSEPGGKNSCGHWPSGRVGVGQVVDDGSWYHSDNEDPSQWVPSNRCVTPTARPGASLHEQGTAIDFTCAGNSFAGTNCEQWARQPTTCNGQQVTHRLNCYGLYNLASEPWHWSTTGR